MEVPPMEAKQHQTLVNASCPCSSSKFAMLLHGTLWTFWPASCFTQDSASPAGTESMECIFSIPEKRLRKVLLKNCLRYSSYNHLSLQYNRQISSKKYNLCISSSLSSPSSLSSSSSSSSPFCFDPRADGFKPSRQDSNKKREINKLYTKQDS